MNQSNARGAVNSYRQVGVQAAIADAQPHRIIQLLMNGALERVNTAKGCIERNRFADKGKHINGAVAIIDGLRSSLDKSAGGELADNLDALYDYMIRRLLEANSSNDCAPLEEVSRLMATIKEGWDAIPEALRRSAETPRRAAP